MNIIKIIRLAIASVILTHAQQLVKLSNWFSKGLIDQQKIDNQKLSQALRVVRERMEVDEEFAEKVFETFSSYDAERFMAASPLNNVQLETEQTFNLNDNFSTVLPLSVLLEINPETNKEMKTVQEVILDNLKTFERKAIDKILGGYLPCEVSNENPNENGLKVGEFYQSIYETMMIKIIGYSSEPKCLWCILIYKNDIFISSTPIDDTLGYIKITEENFVDEIHRRLRK